MLISADTDFGTLLARTGDTAPSVIILRHIQGRRAAQIAALPTANLPQLETDLAAGAVVVIRDDNMRIRRLPFAPRALINGNNAATSNSLICLQCG